MIKIIKYVIADILRNKIVIAYTIFLLAIGMSVFNLEDNTTKGLLSLLNIVLIVVPLVCIIFSTIYIYNSAEFVELLVSQPLQRKHIWLSLFSGIALALTLAFFIGIGIPVLLYSFTATGLILVGVGLLLTTIFVAIALLAAVHTRDKAKGIGIAVLLWLYFSLLFDGLILFILFQFSDYPLENLMLVLSALNPVDMGRILILLKMDISALMGYTGAIFQNFFGTTTGIISTLLVMLLWIVLPIGFSLRKFKRKDL
ncbi:MAG: ABC transporter permease subunit [Hydrotalea flava]|uniref:ABC transporter permease subunit n=1 Tax=Hydrotalea TaxID=1004300 RepID=UPI000943858B|nr:MULTISPECIES: ABC transporter permease subunit [Hydrotalea]NIM36479.1 ABC transporter permease subunit [Hydrotalea flava]NIM39338.1 ABC transporter permease subunit [Hydrotalea flava]NIN04527.1 ABC transporter permease subunit [Hydrotalea flava]NIN16199.1 ABC transporter permease subunit [Hydrotalea flava]NIO95264.1 ABC transporter permease subunit [Hydrotalea flava]